MKITIKNREDVRSLLKSGKTPIQVALIHWKENRELMRENNFDKVKHMNEVCALCLIYYVKTDCGKCSKCPLALAGERCEGGNSLWKKINQGILSISAMMNRRPRFPGASDTSYLAKKIETYDIRLKVLSYTASLVNVLEKLRLKEKNRKIRILDGDKKWISMNNVIYIEDSEGNKIWDIKDGVRVPQKIGGSYENYN